MRPGAPSARAFSTVRASAVPSRSSTPTARSRRSPSASGVPFRIASSSRSQRPRTSADGLPASVSRRAGSTASPSAASPRLADSRISKSSAPSWATRVLMRSASGLGSGGTRSLRRAAAWSGAPSRSRTAL